MYSLTPAYGRDYKSKAAVLTDWKSNKDFIINNFGGDMGRYINRPQLDKGTRVMIRYARLSKQTPATA